MLNIIKHKINNMHATSKHHKVMAQISTTNMVTTVKHFPATTKEWCNSVYAYNKDALKLLPVYDNIITKLIKGYFNFYRLKKLKKLKKEKKQKNLRKGKKGYGSSKFVSRLQKKLRRSTKRIFASKAELKHTNNNVVVTLYVYNNEEKFWLKKLKYTGPRYVSTGRRFLRKMKHIKAVGKRLFARINNRTRANNWATANLSDAFYRYQPRLYRRLIIKSLWKNKRRILYLRELYLNKRKFQETLLLPLNKLLNNIYNKKVNFNIVKLKYFFLDSDVFSQAIAIKMKKRKKILKVLKSCKKLVKIPAFNPYLTRYNFKPLLVTSITSKLKYFAGSSKGKRSTSKFDVLNQFIQMLGKSKSPGYIETCVLRSIKAKSVSGFRIEASGRISKRFTASRSRFKFKHKGSLRNVDSSYKRYPSVLLRGHAVSSIQYTNIACKTRNGSFGLKGWINNY